MPDNLPAPLTPPGCDLRDFPHMQFDVARFRDSAFAAIEDDAAFRAGVMAWAVCWHQVPAASLPEDDRLLCKLLGYGRDVDLWKSIRAAGALHGFMLCSDGRLYHATVAEKACAAWASKQRAREAGIKGNRMRWGKADAKTPGSVADRHPIATRSADDRHLIGEQSQEDRKREGEGEGEGKGEIMADFSAEKSAIATKEISRKSRRDERGERLPADWQPDVVCREFAISEGLDPDRVAASFRDYWHAKPGNSGQKSDWKATWRNWCRREAEQKPQHQKKSLVARESLPPGAPPQPSPRHVWVPSVSKWVNREDLAT